MKKVIPIITILLLIFWGCSSDDPVATDLTGVEDFLPASNDILGWDRGQDDWIARSAADLNRYLGGEAPAYTQRGFIEGAMQQYEGSIAGTATLVEVRVFNQETNANAHRLYLDLRGLMLGTLVTWGDGAGEEAIIERLPTFQRIYFWRYNYFVSLVISAGGDEALNILKNFANDVDVKILDSV